MESQQLMMGSIIHPCARSMLSGTSAFKVVVISSSDRVSSAGKGEGEEEEGGDFPPS